MKRIALIFILSIFSTYCLEAQPLRQASYETMLKTADEQFEKKDYYRALEWYEKAYDESSDNDLIPKIARLHYLLRDYNRAERYFARVLRRDKENKYADFRFDYARCLKMNEEYEDAILEFQQFIDETTNAELRELAKIELQGARMALDLPPVETDFEIENAGRDINSKTSEYSAVLDPTGETMYFAGFNTDDIIEMNGEDSTGNFAKIYTSTMGEKGWGEPQALSDVINRPGFHSSAVALSRNGGTLFFTRAQLEGNTVKESKLYYSIGGSGRWEGAQEVKGINGDYIVKHPAVGELFGSQVLFFSCNKDGGEGGFDIYYATKINDGEYGEPVNLGKAINTPGDEVTPFYQDGTLYFSSNGLPGIGGLDIFYSTWDGVKWSEAENMGKGYNSSVDDKFFAVDQTGYKGILLSNREGGSSVQSKTCCDDIYTLVIPKITANLVVGVFNEDRKPLMGATVDLIDTSSGEINTQTSEKGNRFDYPLEMELPYLVRASKTGYTVDSVAFNTFELSESKTFEYRLYLSKEEPVAPPVTSTTEEVEDPEPLIDTVTIEQAIVLENILYDFNKANIKEQAEQDLEIVLGLMNEYPDMVVELSSHTDYRGDDAFNKDLSQRRAESARRWLAERGIDPNRIQARGYGEQKPQTVSSKVAKNYSFLAEGDVLTPAYIDALDSEEKQEKAHAINRRTEFKIIEGPEKIAFKRIIRREPPEGVEISKLSALYGKKMFSGVPILIVDDRTINLGTVKKGEKRAHTYKITNKGDTKAVISTISHCDCTTIERDFDEIKPGETVELRIIFDSSDKDEAEVIDVDIFLENEIPGYEDPFIERLRYRFDIKK